MSDVAEAFWNLRQGEKKPWISSTFFEKVKVTNKLATYSCDNKPVFTLSRNNILTLRMPGNFSRSTVAINRVGEILMKTNWCLLPSSTTRKRYRIANIVDYNVYWMKAGIKINLITDEISNATVAPLNKRSDELTLQRKYLARNPLKSTAPIEEAGYLILGIEDPDSYSITGQNLTCFIIHSNNREIKASWASANISTLYKIFRCDDFASLHELLKRSEPATNEFDCFLKSNPWVKEHAPPPLQKILALWMLVYTHR